LKLLLIYQIINGAMGVNIQYTCEIDQTMNVLFFPMAGILPRNKQQMKSNSVETPRNTGIFFL